MKEVSSKRVALKIDVIGPENVQFAGASVQPGICTGWGSEGVKVFVQRNS